MDKKWYRSWPVKALLIGTSIVSAALLSVGAINIIDRGSVAKSVIEGDSNIYLDSRTFTDKLASDFSTIRAHINYKNQFETDGKLDLKKTINAEAYQKGSEAALDEKEELTFSLETLVNAYRSYFQDNGYGLGPIYVENANDNIFCFRNVKNSYVYMTEQELIDQIRSGQLVFNGADNVEEAIEEISVDGNTVTKATTSTAVEATLSLIAEMKDGASLSDMGENISIEDADGKTVYSECHFWGYIQTDIQTTKGLSLMALANTSDYWNGRLEDICELTRDTVHEFGTMYDDYSSWQSAFAAGVSNVSYIYVDDSSNAILTNNAEYKDTKKLDQYIKTIEESGSSYFIYDGRSDTIGAQTDINNIDEQEWRSMLGVENGVFAAWIDTNFLVKDDYYSALQTYQTDYAIVKNWMIASGLLLILYIGSLIWLVVIAGRSDKDEELRLNGFDNWKTEAAALLVILVWYVPCFAGLDISYSFRGTDLNRVVMMGLTTAVVFTDIMFLTGLLSLVRRIKAKTVWSNSLTSMVWRYLKIGFDKVGSFAKNVYHNLNSLRQMLLIYGAFVLIHWFAFFSNFYQSFPSFLLMIIAEAAGLVYLVRRSLGRETIRGGVKRIKDGDLEYQIPTEKLGYDQKEIADNINAIGEGLDAAVEESLKSERMKTELITNVSHDLKTPLTSIVNYVDLLKQADIDDPQIKHYIEVLEQKAQRLKVLTEDVVEASKVSSGAITLEKMDINMVEILQQTSGEFEEKFEDKHLQEVMQLPEEPVLIHVDGRRLYRVLENLYNNIAKYALPGSRVYVALLAKEGRAELTLRNISEQPLNITPEELTERFIRGDVARTTEGSGLGLSIAKSLTEIQGGSFELYLDGDLFKVTVSFPIV